MEENKESYKQIFKSTSIVGGAQIINIIIGIIRNKIIAILLGPAGVGVAGIFQTIVELVRNGTGLGINFSGVKNVAENNTDSQRVARTILVLRRWEFGTGLVGMLVVIVLCNFFSNYSFGNDGYTYSIAFMSVTLLISAVSAGQLAILQGLRRIKEMAKATLLGSILGTLISLPIFWWFGIAGIVPSMILTALGSLTVSWYYARKVITEKVQLSLSETFSEGLGMAKLGFFIVVNGFVATISLYVIRVLIRTHLGMDSVGYFQAVWIISTMYINILLNSMLADYFPRLSAIKDNKEASNKLINQQLEMTLLVGTPMLMGMIAFATLAINILYTNSFHSAVSVLKWQMMASFFTFISYTVGVLYLSLNKGWYAIIIETLRQIIYISFVFFGWEYFGFNVLGIGFLIANFVCLVFGVYSAKQLNSFKFSIINVKYILILGSFVGLTLFCSLYLEGFIQYILNGVLLILASAFCLYNLNKMLDIKNWFKARYK
ncbi:oligosaccharide flippase family protein [Flavobacterium sp. JLP]|uniref:oligosaccharide flippase family protein n=1 Tax=Flavobacterium sp. JLP TaxID=2783793 RepID=UPI00188A3BE2|nr:oligosaccharide flippase family protein [Flavobacterium sp. JLP]MBF4507171.1 oligosaccharide flippase family protein [Flavobacterium sp. JLP]